MIGGVREVSVIRGTVTRIELAAIAYLAIPVATFLIAYTKMQVWVPGAAFIAFALWQCAVRLEPVHKPQDARLGLYFWAVSALVVFASGSFGLVHTNSDWIKHFAVFRFFLDNDSLIGTASGYDGGTLRYYVAWYVIPGLAAKLFSKGALLYLVGAWTTLGLYLFLSVAANLTERKTWRYVLPVIFLLFSGADAIGTAITGFSLGPAYHIEWWAGWVEFSSNLTDIIWAPQHALSAWIGAALALRLVRNPSSLIVIPVLTMTMVLWSPFSGIGLIPFFLYALWLNVRHLTIAAVVNGALMLALIVLLGRYMRIGTETMPLAPVWNHRCLGQGPCYSFPAYILFVGLEVVPAILICQVATRWRDAMVWIASISLLLMPFIQFGAFNDLNLHGSLPALAVLSIAAWKVVAGAARWLKVAFAATLLAGLPTPMQEVRRAFLMEEGPTTDMTFSYLFEHVAWLRPQYMIDRAPWIIRRPPASPNRQPHG